MHELQDDKNYPVLINTILNLKARFVLEKTRFFCATGIFQAPSSIFVS